MIKAELPGALAVRYERLLAYIKELGRCAVAYSGGVDSTFLLQAATHALGKDALGITISTVLQPRWEQELATENARKMGTRQEVVTVDILAEEAVASNPMDRCYHCKKCLFSAVLERAAELGYDTLLDGTNVDDQGDYRPGQEAAKELGVKSPLLACGYTKKEIREASKALGLMTHDLPSYACLASRIPYGTPLCEEALSMVERAEDVLRDLGFRQNRVRLHGDLDRIEVEEQDILRVVEQREEIYRALVGIGFSYVTLDVQGFSTGSMNIAIGKKEA